MATPVMYDAFFDDIAEGVHAFGTDQLVVALLPAANAPNASTHTVYGDYSGLEASYTNCSTRNITLGSSTQTSGTYKLILNDLTLSASGGTVGPFKYIVIYNDGAATDELVCYLNYGSDYTIADGDSFKIDFDGTNGLFTIAAA